MAGCIIKSPAITHKQKLYFPEVLTGVVVFDIALQIVNQKCLFKFHFTMTSFVRGFKWLQKI